MKIPLSWLKEYVDWPWSPEELAERLTMAGVKIELVEKLGEGIRGAVAARVVKVQPHPNPAPAGAEGHGHWVVDLEVGDRRRQAVAGIANMGEGDVVAYAPPGSVLPGQWQIGTASIRGVTSEGMLLSLSELVLGEKPREGEGVLVLPPETKPGAELGQALGLPETVLELDLTPNYAVHCQSIIGVAREVAAITGAGPQGVRRPDPYPSLQPKGEPAAASCDVTILDPDLCPRYVARVIRGVGLGLSPWLVQFRVLAAGMRPINNVVDATNYVMLEYGQPLHAFDLGRVRGGHILVRRAKAGEKLVTLDGVERVLRESDLVIADETSPVAIAGVMGGENSEVTAETRDILLESAVFEPISVRRTATRLALVSEAAGRFDKGVDPEGAEPASARCAALIARSAGGAVAPGAVDRYPLPFKPREINLRTPRVSALLGVELGQGEVSTYLGRLGFGARSAAAPDLVVTIPSWRRDVFEEADLTEEVGRLYGYDRIPPALPRLASTVGIASPRARLSEKAKRAMVAAGFNEVVNSSLVDPERDAVLSPAEARPLVLANPMTADQSAMRTGLLGSLLEAVRFNLARAERSLRLFEVAPAYLPPEGELRPANMPVERQWLAAVALGTGPEVSWRDHGSEPDFYYAKGLAALVLRDLGLVGWQASPSQDRRYHPGRRARIVLQRPGLAAGRGEGFVELGTVGELHPQVLRGYDIAERVVALELDLDAVAHLAVPEVRFEEMPRFPAVARDVAVILPEAVDAGRIEAVITAAAGALGVGVELFDVYRGHPVPQGQRSTAWRVVYRSAERSLTDAEVDEVHGRVRAALEKELGAALR